MQRGTSGDGAQRRGKKMKFRECETSNCFKEYRYGNNGVFPSLELSMLPEWRSCGLGKKMVENRTIFVVYRWLRKMSFLIFRRYFVAFPKQFCFSLPCYNNFFPRWLSHGKADDRIIEIESSSLLPKRICTLLKYFITSYFRFEFSWLCGKFWVTSGYSYPTLFTCLHYVLPERLIRFSNDVKNLFFI